MLFSIGLIFLGGLALGRIFQMLKLPSLLGMLIVGMILGSSGLSLLDDQLIGISSELREIALIIILMRAGLNMDLDALKKLGKPALYMCFVPACFEIIAVTFLASFLFHISLVEAALLGCVLAAVSPAVIVPRMLRCIEQKAGVNRNIPQLVMAGASVDDVFVIILFALCLSLNLEGNFEWMSLLQLPLSIIIGILIGLTIGSLLCLCFKSIHMRDSSKILIMLSISFLLVSAEDQLAHVLAFSSLLSIMAMGVMLMKKLPIVANRCSLKFSKLWVAAELWLFVLVGASVNIEIALDAGGMAVLLVVVALIVRSIGVYLSIAKLNLTQKERMFIVFSYLPKATVQAAIGGIALAHGLAVGELILAIAVISILLSAPLGAFLIDRTYQTWLTKC